MSIIKVLKGINAVAGYLSEIKHSLGMPRKSIIEAIGIGLPAWDPPEPRPPAPPDHEAVARAKEVIQMGSLQEKQTFDRAMQKWRQVRDGQPQQPSPAERKVPQEPGPRPQQGASREG